MSREVVQLPGRVAGARLLARGADEVHALVRARARAEGERDARERGCAALDAAVTRVGELEQRLGAELAHAATELAVEIARVLLRRELPAGGYELERIVRETLAEAAVGRSPCVVHLNPADHAQLSGTRFRSGTRVEPDEGVPRGDVHVETPLGLLVRDLEGALDAIAKKLTEQLE